MAWEWRLIQENCTGCGICADVCPHDAIRMPREVAYPLPVPAACVGCMICIDECPFAALEVRELSPAART
jgi:Pyruvate/2-oxoacid:ferredoxin oxidoreductase delta subunit